MQQLFIILLPHQDGAISLSVNLVTAAGIAITVNPHNDPDLWWALRGAGANFGIVTSATMKSYSVPKAENGAWLGTLIYTDDKIEEIVEALNIQGLIDIFSMPTLPRSLSKRLLMAMKALAQCSGDRNEPSSVLVIGGCGFVGYHLVSHFIEDTTFSCVAAASRSAHKSKDRVSGASYHDVDLTDADSIEKLIDTVKPTVIVHAASPSPVTGTPKDYYSVTIQGTKDLLRISKKSKDVQALIYTSSSLLCKGPEHINRTEESLLADSDPKAPGYARAKALAEKLVLSANEPLSDTPTITKEVISWEGYLCTGALRFPIIYGTHDLVCIPGALNALQKGRTNVILGNGKNLWSFCSVKNAAISHVLLVRALLDTQKRRAANLTMADGEAFYIHDGESHRFWDFARMIWELAGHKPKNVHIFHLSMWFVLGLSSFLELVFWVFTFGTKRPYQLGKQQVEYALFEHTYSIEKARKVLGYEPIQDFEEGLREAVMWSLEHDGWAKRLEKVVRG